MLATLIPVKSIIWSHLCQKYHQVAHLSKVPSGRTPVKGTNDVVKAALQEYFAKLDRNFFTDRISKLITWYKKYLSRMGAYVEK